MSKGNIDWRDYVNSQGDFELPNYLYRMIMELMKQALDMGTLLSDDDAKLRAYKEQIKKHFKGRWADVAKALEFFDMVDPCTCRPKDYCEICGGSRFLLSAAIAPDHLRETAVFYAAEEDTELANKLHKGLIKAQEDLEKLDYDVLPEMR